MKIISGGQSGADRAALDAAIHLGIAHGGWIPRGRKTESGPLPPQYRLKQTTSSRYRDRTERNVLDSDGTLIVSFGPLTRGSALTEALTLRHDKPCLHLDLHAVPEQAARRSLSQWLIRHRISTLNVAGPRASHEPGIYAAVYLLLCNVLTPNNFPSEVSDNEPA